LNISALLDLTFRLPVKLANELFAGAAPGLFVNDAVGLSFVVPCQSVAKLIGFSVGGAVV
jgi:hypothetical protein